MRKSGKRWKILRLIYIVLFFFYCNKKNCKKSATLDLICKKKEM